METKKNCVMCSRIYFLNQEKGMEILKILGQKADEKRKIWLPDNLLES